MAKSKEKFVEDRFESKVPKKLLSKLEKVREIRVFDYKGNLKLIFEKKQESKEK
jgi:hypothetical protein